MTKYELRKKWVEALRSNKYRQGMGYLRTQDSYCCLGVLCDVYGVVWEFDREQCSWEAHGKKSVCPFLVQQAVGMCTPEGLFDGGTLARMNDRGDSFEEIADVIESEPEGLFE